MYTHENSGVTPSSTRQPSPSRGSEGQSSSSEVMYTPDDSVANNEETNSPTRSDYEPGIPIPADTASLPIMSTPLYVVTEPSVMQPESVVLCSVLGEGQRYLRPGSFYELFDPERGDTAAVRYQTILRECRHHLAPLDYELPSMFVSRMHSIRLEKDIPARRLPHGAIQAAYLNWAVDDKNWPFLRQEDGSDLKLYAPFGGQLENWPAKIIDVLNSPMPLVNEKGHFVVPADWLDEETASEWDRIEDAAAIKYRFARLIARKDPNVLPHEGRKEYLVRQLELCKSRKSMAELNAQYDSWFQAPKNLPLVPFRFGTMPYDTRDLRYLTVRPGDNFWDRNS